MDTDTNEFSITWEDEIVPKKNTNLMSVVWKCSGYRSDIQQSTIILQLYKRKLHQSNTTKNELNAIKFMRTTSFLKCSNNTFFAQDMVPFFFLIVAFEKYWNQLTQCELSNCKYISQEALSELYIPDSYFHNNYTGDIQDI